ncbi:MAG: class F sortase [Candidatus Paceibacterota bacterium]
MKIKILSKKLLAVVFLGVAIFLAFIFYFIKHNSIQPFDHIQIEKVLMPPTIKNNTKVALPVRLQIPKINVDAFVEYIGLTAQGDMDVPKGPTNVAWYNLGPRPGEIGSAVISGHYGWKDNILAVFDNLYKLQKGDQIYIEDEKGIITTFVVRESRLYDTKANATEVFSSSDGKAHLNLITCEGVWDKVSKSYSRRLVVLADKE